MINEQQFTSLLQRMESETLDFKEKGYRLDIDKGGLDFVKDVLAMANTPREDTSYIVLGVRKHADGSCDLIGLASHPDDADLQSQFENRVFPPPEFSYCIVKHDNKDFGIIEIPPVRKGPSVPVSDYGKILRFRQIYFRRGSKNDIPTSEDVAQIIEWFRKDVPPRAAYEDGSRPWERFLRAVDGFDPANDYVVVLSPGMQDSSVDSSSLGAMPWLGAIDFDPESDINGILFRVLPELEKRRSLHRVTTQERFTINPRSATYWYFAQGIRTPGEVTGISMARSWREWDAEFGSVLGEFVSLLARSSLPTPLICVVLWYESSMTRHLDSTLRDVNRAYGDAAKIVIVTNEPESVRDIARDFDAEILEIPFNQLCAGLASHFSIELETNPDVISLPTVSGASLALPPKDEQWLKEEIDLVDLSSGLVPQSDREIGREFLSGAEISWFELGIHYDIERDIHSQLKRQVEAELIKRRTSRVNLYHEPGAGGTTVGRRLLWEFHNEYPVGILRKCTPLETAERLYQLSSITGSPLLLLIDGGDITESQVDDLYNHLRARHVPAVLLQVLRRFSLPSKAGQRVTRLPIPLTSSEAYRFATIFKREAPQRSNEIEALVTSTDSRHRSAFYFGLTAFREDFRGLESYIRIRIQSLTPVQQQIVGFLALAHRYAQRPLPAQAFAKLLGQSAGRKIDLTAWIPTSVLDLLIEVDKDDWRTAHDLIAGEILQQHLTKGTQDRRRWRQQLPSFAIDFAEFCRESSREPNDEMLDVVRRAFVFRDNTELLGTERSATPQFPQLIQDMLQSEGGREGTLRVLKKLTDLYPDEAHFWAHLGRFYSIERDDYEQAQKYISRAIELVPHDGLLHHMRGMAIRQHLYQMMEQRIDLSDAIAEAQRAGQSFDEARLYRPDDDYGYISEVQMLTRLVDYAGQHYQGGVLEFMRSPKADPFVRDSLERAEDLLERVRRNREGQESSRYESSCRAGLDSLYGNYSAALQTWGNLLSRQDVYSPPIRRQIVWTYLARQKRSGRRCPKTKSVELSSSWKTTYGKNPTVTSTCVSGSKQLGGPHTRRRSKP